MNTYSYYCALVLGYYVKIKGNKVLENKIKYKLKLV